VFDRISVGQLLSHFRDSHGGVWDTFDNLAWNNRTECWKAGLASWNLCSALRLGHRALANLLSFGERYAREGAHHRSGYREYASNPSNRSFITLHVDISIETRFKSNSEVAQSCLLECRQKLLGRSWFAGRAA
jgi:hypothetical protein